MSIVYTHIMLQNSAIGNVFSFANCSNNIKCEYNLMLFWLLLYYLIYYC